MAVKKRYGVANYLDVGVDSTAEFVLMGAGFTELEENPAATTASKRYVNDKSATKSITGYDWSTPFVTDQIRDEKAVDFICNIGEQQLTGADAETDYVIVDLDKKSGDSGSAFKARKIRVAIEVATFTNTDGDMGATGNLLGVGDIITGSFDTNSRTFTADGAAG